MLLNRRYVVGSTGEANLILGMVENMEWAELRPFVHSLKQTGFTGEIRLFVAGIDPSTFRRLRREGVHVHDFRRLRHAV